MNLESQKSQSLIRTDKARPEESGSEPPAQKKRLKGPTLQGFFGDRLRKRLDNDGINNCLILEASGSEPPPKKILKSPTLQGLFEDRLQKRLDDDGVKYCLILEILEGHVL